ncbi:hypothetical protein, partial [Chitinimonas sp.]|uniref:hypothetical protein n=1 Tax=Chitinimonas sp. TaxID=1934313 RepID=UPI002F941792
AWFRPDDTITPEADRLFAALCSGQLLTLGALAQAAVSVGAVVDAKGWLLSTASTLSEQRLSLNFFGIQFANTQTWLNTVSVKTDLVTGNLLAATAASTGGTGIVNPWKNRTAKLGVQLALAGDEGAPRQLAATLNGAFTANRENTDRETVQDLLDAYADAVGTKRNDIGLLLDIPSPSDSDGLRRFWKSLTIAVPVALDAQQWAAFASLGKADIERVSLEIALAQFQRAYKADSLFSKDPVGDLREQILAVTNASKADNDAILGYLKLFPENIVTGDLAVSAAEAVGITARDNDIADRGMRRFKAYHRLSATVQAPLRLRTLATQASDQIKALPEQPDPDAVRKQLEPILAKMQAALSPVALVSETWLGIGVLGAKDQPVSWPYASFITTMAKLAGLPVPPGFVPIAQVGDKPAVRLIAAG